MDIICAYSDSDSEGEKSEPHQVNLNSSRFGHRVPLNHGKDDSDIKSKEIIASLESTRRDIIDSRTCEREPEGHAEELKTRHTEDDPHQGRIRSFPHVEGQFATHVYVEIDQPRDEKTVKLLADLCQLLQSSVTGLERIFSSEADSEPSMHLSLSRTVPITSIQIHSLLNGLRHGFNKMKKSSKLHLTVGSGAQVLVNDEGTRTFVALKVVEKKYPVTNQSSNKSETSVRKWIDIVSKVFLLHGLPEYYDNPCIHTSIAWCVGNSQRSELENLLLKYNKLVESISWSVCVSRVLCKIGKKEHIIWDFGSR
jgi:hypothetical protein